MFSSSFETQNNIDLLVLRDEQSGCSAAIIPSIGAMLHRFEVPHENGVLNVIDHYSTREALSTGIEIGGFKSAKLSPFVCRLNEGKYRFGNHDLKIEKFYLGPHALHGIIYDAAYNVKAHEANESSAWAEMETDYAANDAGYPFPYRCIVRYELKENNQLFLSTRIINTGEGLIPMADGWHPYFTFGGSINDLQLEFQSIRKIEFDAGMIPTGAMHAYQEFSALSKIGSATFDDCFELNFAECQPMIVLRDPVKKMQLEIFPERSYPYFQLYTPAERKSIALENLSALPDAFNNGFGLLTLAAGEEKIFRTSYKISTVA